MIFVSIPPLYDNGVTGEVVASTHMDSWNGTGLAAATAAATAAALLNRFSDRDSDYGPVPEPKSSYWSVAAPWAQLSSSAAVRLDPKPTVSP